VLGVEGLQLLARGRGRELDPFGHAEPGRVGAQEREVALIALADHREPRIVGEARESVDRHVDSLTLVDAPHVEQPPGPGPLGRGLQEAGMDPRRRDLNAPERQPFPLRSPAHEVADEHPAIDIGRVERGGDPGPAARGAPPPSSPREHAHPGVNARPVEQPVVVYEGDGRQTGLANACDQRQRHPAHRPPRHDIGPQLGQAAVERRGVVALQPQALGRRQAREAMVAPVPAQLATHIGILGQSRGLGVAEVGGQHADRVAGVAHVRRGRPAHQLVAAEVVRWVHVRDEEGAHAPEDRAT